MESRIVFLYETSPFFASKPSIKLYKQQKECSLWEKVFLLSKRAAPMLRNLSKTNGTMAGIPFIKHVTPQDAEVFQN